MATTTALLRCDDDLELVAVAGVLLDAPPRLRDDLTLEDQVRVLGVDVFHLGDLLDHLLDRVRLANGERVGVAHVAQRLRDDLDGLPVLAVGVVVVLAVGVVVVAPVGVVVLIVVATVLPEIVSKPNPSTGLWLGV